MQGGTRERDEMRKNVEALVLFLKTQQMIGTQSMGAKQNN